MKRHKLHKRYGHTHNAFDVGTRVVVISGPWARHCGVVKMYQGPQNIWVRLDPELGARYGLGSTHSFSIDRLHKESE